MISSPDFDFCGLEGTFLALGSCGPWLYESNKEVAEFDVESASMTSLSVQAAFPGYTELMLFNVRPRTLPEERRDLFALRLMQRINGEIERCKDLGRLARRSFVAFGWISSDLSPANSSS